MAQVKKPFTFRFPEGKGKAVALSFDDGAPQDDRLVEILNRCGLKGTFHLNTGRRGGSDFAERVLSRYDGHEVSCHGSHHMEMNILSREILAAELLDNRRRLEEIVQRPIRGFSYPYGTYTPELVSLVKELGFAYARGIERDTRMLLPTDHWEWLPTSGTGDDFVGHGRRLLAAPDHPSLVLMLLWGHSYDFDKSDTWAAFEELCTMMQSEQALVWSTTCIDYVDYINAARALRCSVDGRCVENPSAREVWILAAGESRCIGPGDMVALEV